jgi:phospholipase D1/2
MEKEPAKFPWIKILLIAAALLGLLLMREELAPWLHPSELSKRIAALGFWAPAAFIVVYIVAPLFLFPAMLFTIVAALIWDGPRAFVYVTLAANISANLGFFAGRKLGSERIERLTHDKIKEIENMFVRSGVVGVFTARMLPIAPFHVVNVAAGATRLQWSHFFWGTLLASVPGRMLTIYLVGNFDLRTPETWLTIAGLALLIAVPHKIQELRNLRQLAREAASPDMPH